ncbi:flagellar hook capping protein N-terminal domain protein [Bacteriovorax sp. BSW11_IV]|uniref:flagellar hook assembly protein FlgD n=1 Tax=Bacteriovorax sp. BSW11_IV TaxID=1353529 RepID=UPI00038A51C8|nr:flagellar hook assembly protein FlgD [Bacteriovorax sp. BSW11_IV]EQC45884.1 flagellar hook capping protein N-terminal domain protein [Bacteriovorax sp. BSW11_IV]
MAQIGKPASSNDFAGIQMAQKTIGNGKRKKTTVGEQLNKLSGVEEKSRFVNREEHNKMGKDGFLKLLAHQMQNQDPMKPMDQKQFAADLAQFSQLEQMTNMNAKLDNFGKNAPQELKFYGASFLGKEVVTNGTTVNYDGKNINQKLPFYLEKPAKNVIVNVFDSKNQMVAQLEGEGLGQGQQSLEWNGYMLDGTKAPKESYRFQVLAWDKDMSEFRGQTKASGVVTGINFEDGETVLTLNDGKKLFLRDVESFKLPNGEQTNSLNEQKNPALQKNAMKAYNGIEGQL